MLQLPGCTYIHGDLMELKATYNLLILLLIYSFSCVCVKGIEAVYDTSLNMAVVFNNMWTATIETIFLSLVVTVCVWFNRPSKNGNTISAGLSTATLVFNTIWFVGLTVVVMGNLSGFGNILVGKLKTAPFLWGAVVNIVAVVLYCLSFFTVEKYGTNTLYKTIVSGMATIFSISSVIFSTSYMPINVMQAVYKDGKCHELLQALESEIKANPNFDPNLSSWAESSEHYVSEDTKKDLETAVQAGDINVLVIDDTHIKMTWKRHIDPEELNKLPATNEILNSYKRWHDWGCFYKQTEKVVEMTEKIKKEKSSKNVIAEIKK